MKSFAKSAPHPYPSLFPSPHLCRKQCKVFLQLLSCACSNLPVRGTVRLPLPFQLPFVQARNGTGCSLHSSHILPTSLLAAGPHQQHCRDCGREKGSICGINPWICPPALAFLHFPSQYCPGLPPVLPAHLRANRALQIPGMLQAAEPSSGSPASLLHGTCGKLSWEAHRILLSLALGRDAGHCSIPEATAHSAGTHTTAPTPNPPPGPSPKCHGLKP